MSSDRWERLLKKLDKALNKNRRRVPRRRPQVETLDERVMMAADVWTPRDDGPTIELFPAERPIDQNDYTTPRLDESSRDGGPIPLAPENGGIDQSDYTTPRPIPTSNPQFAAAQEDFGTTGGTDGSTGGTDGSTGGTDGSTGGTDGSTGGTGGTDGSTGGTDGSTGGYDYSTNAPYVTGGFDHLYHWVADQDNDLQLDLDSNFNDADEGHGDDLTFSAEISETSDPNVVAVDLDSSSGALTLTYGEVGAAQITFTATDKANQSDSFTCNVFVVEVAGVSVEERVKGMTAWQAPDDGTVLWTMDDHRWSVDVNPDIVQDDIQSMSFQQKAWDDRDDENVLPDELASAGAGDNWALGELGAGDWTVRATVAFPAMFQGGNPVVAESTTDAHYAQISVTGVGWKGYQSYADQNPNLSMIGGDYRFYAERNHPLEYKDGTSTPNTPDHELHNNVDVEVTINPPIPQGMTGTLDLKVYDPDNALADGTEDTKDDGDPDAFLDGKERPDDNYGPPLDLAADELTFAAETTSQRTTATLGNGARQPGNNYIVAVSGDMKVPANHYYFDDDAVTLCYDDVQPDSGGGTTTQKATLPPNLQTKKLTVWRTLRVELDSMGDPDDPDAAQRGTFTGELGNAGSQYEDDEKFDPRLPDAGLMYGAYPGACVMVSQLPADYDKDDDLPFYHNLALTNAQAINYGSSARNVEAEANFWTVQIIGAYEHGNTNWDWDGDTHDPAAGWNFDPADGGPIYIFEETIRDAAATYPNSVDEAILEQRAVLHESLHSFLGMHSSDPDQHPSEYGADEGIMDGPTAFTEEDEIPLTHRQLRYIQADDGKYDP